MRPDPTIELVDPIHVNWRFQSNTPDHNTTGHE